MKSPETNGSSKKCIGKEVSLLPNSQRYGIEILSQKRISCVLMESGKFKMSSSRSQYLRFVFFLLKKAVLLL